MKGDFEKRKPKRMANDSGSKGRLIATLKDRFYRYEEKLVAIPGLKHKHALPKHSVVVLQEKSASDGF